MLIHVEPREVALVAIAAEPNRGGTEKTAEERRPEEISHLRPSDEEEGEGQEKENDGATEIGLFQTEEHEEPRHDEVRQKTNGKRFDLLGLLGQGVCEPDDERELRDLRRLHVHGSKSQPPRGAPARATEADEASDEQEAGADEEGISEPVEAVVVDAAHAEECEECGDGVGRLPLQKELRVVVLDCGLNGGGAVDHDHPETDQGDDDRGEDGIERVGGSSAVLARVEWGGES
jgi:hypothetical protein